MIQVTHHLKIDKKYYDRITTGEKMFEVRFNDRDFQAGDSVFFAVDAADSSQEYVITYVLHSFRGLVDGWVVLGLSIVGGVTK